MKNLLACGAAALLLIIAAATQGETTPDHQRLTPVYAQTHGKAQAPVKVLVSVHPLALVVASLVAQPQVLVPANVTPHDFSFRPSDIRKIQDADIIIWNGADTEPYLARFARRWPQKHWIDVSALGEQLIHTQTSASTPATVTAPASSTTPGKAPAANHQHSHDSHWWFAPPVMLALQQQLAGQLGMSAAPFQQQVQQQLAASRAQLQPLQQQGFFVFHQAYDHWVEYFGLSQLGAFTVSPEQKPGLRTLTTMRQQLLDEQVVCVFTEPQFSSALVDSVVGNLPVRRVELDPLGRHISVTQQGYPDFIQDLTQRFVQCLSPRS